MLAEFTIPVIKTVYPESENVLKRFTRLKNANSLGIFKSELKKWKPEHCPCWLCTLCVQNFGFI